MTDRELRHLSRKELLELLVDLKSKNERLQNELSVAQSNLNDRNIKMDKAGSLAEAALAYNGVYETADVAAKQYLENIQRYLEEIKKRDEASKIKCERIIAEAQQKAEAIVADAEYIRRNRLREMELSMIKAENEKR